MWYRRIDKNCILGETDHYEADDNMEGAIVPHPRSSHGHYGYLNRYILKAVPYMVYARHKDKRIFWMHGDKILLPDAPHWAYRFIDVYRHGGIAYAETLTTCSAEKHSRGWDWSTCELLWILDERKQAEMLKKVEKLKKNGLKGKKADILKNLVDDAFEHDLMWLDLEKNGEYLDNDEFLEEMGMTFEEWEEEH